MKYSKRQLRAMWYHEKARRIATIKARGLWDEYREYCANRQYDCITGFYNHIKVDERTGERFAIAWRAAIYYGGDRPAVLYFKTRQAARAAVEYVGNGSIDRMRVNAERAEKYLTDAGESWAYLDFWRIPLGSGVRK